MTRADITRLDRRIDGVDENVRALSDSIVEIREVQDRHTAMLGTLDGRVGRLEAGMTRLDDRVGRLEAAVLQIGAQLTEVLRRLPEPD